jgi:GH15 family glucan-1,4-alpha-glucosidase
MNRIGDYALLSDCHSAALVGPDGAVDWACFPRFDSPSVFARALDSDRGGHLTVAPVGIRTVRRRYLDDTNVLSTTWECSGGVLELTDCMPVDHLADDDPTTVRAHASILRRATCVTGAIDLRVDIAPRFEYAALRPRFRLTSDRTAEIVGGPSALWITASRPLVGQADALTAEWTLRAGEQVWLDVAWTPSNHVVSPAAAPSDEVLALRLERTIDFWREWMAACWYSGEHADAVRRSALALKGLTFAPTGAVVAAATTSLPERIGGERNWDYRYTWIRDATLTLISLFVLGFTDEADAFKVWLERTGAGRPADLQLMYGVGGERLLPEFSLSHLAGHRRSRPVRIGNAAYEQRQLDMYGQILQAAYLYGRAERELTESNWQFLSGLADVVCERWQLPDHGIWEIRDAPRHFTHSKLNCWLALDRAVRIAEATGLPEDPRWRHERDELRVYLEERGAVDGWFTQAVGNEAADASTLLVPAVGFLPTTHPKVAKTVEVVLRELERDGLVARYHVPDGLRGGEGEFLLCSFWLADCLIHAGRVDEADELVGRLLALSNDVGLYAEEVDGASGEMLGNFPQAFTHMALVTTCAHLSAAKRGEVPFDGAHDYAELALERLLRGRGRGRT